MSYQLKLNAELPREILTEFAKYIVPYIRDFANSAEGRRYIAQWQIDHPQYDSDIRYTGYDYDDEDDDM